jgi:hypothetical protein
MYLTLEREKRLAACAVCSVVTKTRAEVFDAQMDKFLFWAARAIVKPANERLLSE